MTGTTASTTATTNTGNRNKFYNVTYTKNTYNLNISYIYDPDDTNMPEGLGGTQAADSYTAALPYGDPYSVDSPTIDGFYPSVATVSGTMPGNDLTIQVKYTSQHTIYDLTVTWGDMTFDYDPGLWVPTSHSYMPMTSRLTPRTDSSTGEKLNKVTVTSSEQTTDPVKLTYSYAQDTGYEDFTATFWRNDSMSGVEMDVAHGESVTLAPNNSETVWLFLEGQSDTVEKGQLYKVGTCTVYINPAD